MTSLDLNYYLISCTKLLIGSPVYFKQVYFTSAAQSHVTNQIEVCVYTEPMP